MITVAQIKLFFQNLWTDAESVEEKAVATAGLFLRSTYAALIKDPVVTQAFQDGFSEAEAEVMAAVEAGGLQVIPAAVLAATVKLAVKVGVTVEHELVAIFKAELHSKVAASTIGTPQVQNP